VKIVFVSDVVYPYVRGGAEKRIYETARRLAAAGHEVHVYGIKWWEGPGTIDQGGVTLHGVCRPRALYVNGRRSVAEALWFTVCLIGPLLRERCDVIDCNEHPYFPLFACKIARLARGGRLYATWHEVWGDYWYEYMGAAGILGKLVERVAAHLPDGVIAVSDRTASDLAALGVRRDRITVVPNGIPVGCIRSIPPANETCDVIYAGRLIKEKHVDVLLRACAGMPVRLTVIGDGPERAALEALASELKVRATFTGFLEEDELIARMKAAKVFVLPSTREGFSITTLEAMACGLPVITVDAPRNYAKELVGDGATGKLVPLDEKSIQEAINEQVLGKYPGKMGQDPGAIDVNNYDWDTLVKQLENVYKNK
jgi:glycosyltransferase involved in cell wall biosynthesis